MAAPRHQDDDIMPPDGTEEQEDGPEATAVKEKPRRAAKRKAKVEEPEETDDELDEPGVPGAQGSSIEELEILSVGGESAQIQVERLDPSVYRGRKVQTGYFGFLPKTFTGSIFDEVFRLYGGGTYKVWTTQKTAKGKMIPPVVRKIPGIPRPKDLEEAKLTADDEEAEEEEERIFGPGGAGRGGPPPMGMPGMPGPVSQMNLGWVFVPAHRDYIWTGPGQYPTSIKPPAPGDRRPQAPFFAPGQGVEEESDTARALREVLKANEIRDRKEELAAIDRKWEDRFEKMMAAISTNAKPTTTADPLASMTSLLQQQALTAEADRKMKADAEEKRWARERDEAQKKLDKEERERKEDRDRREADAKARLEKEDRDRKDERERREADEKRERERREADMKYEREREDARRADEQKRQDQMFRFITESKKEGGFSSYLKDLTALKGLTGDTGERSELADAKEMLAVGGQVLSENIVPALTEAILAWKGVRMPNPADGAQTVTATVVDPGQGQQQQPQAPPQALPGPQNGTQQQAPAQPPPVPVQQISNAHWLTILKNLTDSFKAGNSPEATIPLLHGLCRGAGIDYKSAVVQVSGMGANPFPTIATLKRVEPLTRGEVQAHIKQARESLESEPGKAWFLGLARALTSQIKGEVVAAPLAVSEAEPAEAPEA